MALLPRMLRPSVLLRRKAMYSGFLGNSGFWKFVGLLVFGKSILRKFFGKTPEVIEVTALGPERYMQVTTAKPMTRRRRRKLAKRGDRTLTLSERKALGQLWAAEQDDARRAS